MKTIYCMLILYLLYNTFIMWYLKSADEEPEKFNFLFKIKIILFAPFIMFVAIIQK